MHSMRGWGRVGPDASKHVALNCTALDNKGLYFSIYSGSELGLESAFSFHL